MVSLPVGLNSQLYEAPKLVIVRQPKKRGYRFRYRSEGETHGGIPGEPDPQSSGSKKFYPTIQLKGHHGAAKIVVTLVSADDQKLLHAHSMIVNKELKKGFCIFDMPKNSNILELKNIAIQHAVKDRLNLTLMDRLLQDRFVRQFGWNSALKVGETILDISHYTDRLEDRDENSGQFLDRNTAKMIAGIELKHLEEEAQKVAKTMAMNTCRLCFQAFLQDSHGKYTTVLDRVFSDVIIDGKTKEGAMLKIIRLSKAASPARGGEEVWLLADKLNADDVEVRFYLQSKESGKVEWEGFGEFSKGDVFKQAVLIFKTPRFDPPNLKNLENPVKVHMQLRRKKDITCASMPTEFTYKPDRYDHYQLGAKRKKPIPNNVTSYLQQQQPQQPKPDPNTTLNFMNTESFKRLFNNATTVESNTSSGAGASAGAAGVVGTFMMVSSQLPCSSTIREPPVAANNLPRQQDTTGGGLFQQFSSTTSQQQPPTSMQFPAFPRQQTPSASSNPSIGESPSPVFPNQQLQNGSEFAEPMLFQPTNVPMATNNEFTLPNDFSMDSVPGLTDSFLGGIDDIKEEPETEPENANLDFPIQPDPQLMNGMTFTSYLNNFDPDNFDPESNQGFDDSSNQG